jgi:dihydrofolate reductase
MEKSNLNSMISIIVAIDAKRGMGKNNSIPWKISGEQRRFREITTPHPIIMGRKTFVSIGRVLPDRTNIVVSRSGSEIQNSDGMFVVNSLEEGIDFAKSSPGSEEIFIIGGGQIFAQAIDKNLVDRLYLTLVDGDFDCDTFFPDYSNFTKVISEEPVETEDFKYKFLTLEK